MRVFAWLLILSGVFMAALQGLDRSIALLEWIHPAGIWRYKEQGIGFVVSIWSVLLIGIGILSLAIGLRTVHLDRLLREMTLEAARAGHAIASICRAPDSKVILGVALCIGILARGVFLDQPLRYDEARTYVEFIDAGPLNVFYCPIPNNHVPNTLLIKASTLLLGTSELTIRLPALLFGLAGIVALFILARMLGFNGLMAALLMATWPYLVFYSVNGRGYTMIVLVFILLLISSFDLLRRPTMAGSVYLGLLGAVALFAMPSMLFAIAGIVPWVAWGLLRSAIPLSALFKRHALPFLVVLIVLTATLYTPVIFVSNGIGTMINNQHVDPRPWGELTAGLLPHFTYTLSNFVRDVPLPILFFLGGLTLMGTFRILKHPERWAIMTLPVFLLVGMAVVLVYKQRIPFDRTWIYTLPVVFLVLEAGWSAVANRSNSRFRSAFSLGLVVVAFGWMIRLVSTPSIRAYPDTGLFRDAPVVARFLGQQWHSNDRITALDPVDVPVEFYLRNMTGSNSGNARDSVEYIVVDKTLHSLKDVTEDQCELIFRMGATEIHQVVR